MGLLSAQTVLRNKNIRIININNFQVCWFKIVFLPTRHFYLIDLKG